MNYAVENMVRVLADSKKGALFLAYLDGDYTPPIGAENPINPKTLKSLLQPINKKKTTCGGHRS